jgi:FkbM family methyltransferase
MEYKSQYNQDKYLNENFFKDKRNGTFVDIGAHDGVSISNSYFFEKYLNWTGMCIEPMPELFKELEKNRDCIKINGCAWEEDTVKTFRLINGYAEMLSGILDSYDERHKERIELECRIHGGSYRDIEMNCYNVNNLLEKYNLFNIDFMSIDTEGSEFEILKTIDFEKFDIKIVIVENNYNDSKIREFMEMKKYKLHDKLSCDDLYIKID